MATFECPKCGKRYQAGDHLAGRKIRCKACGETIRIAGGPADEAESSDPWEDPSFVPPPAIAPARRMAGESVRTSRPRAQPEKKSGVPVWVWVAGGTGLFTLLICGGIVIVVVGFVRNVVDKAVAAVGGSPGVTVSTAANLAEARRGHQTRLLNPGPSPQEYDNSEAPDGVEMITFRSGEHELFGYFAKPAGDGPFPAVLHAHGGMAFGVSDFDDVRPLLDAGFAVFVPVWRGENGNPGHYETCYGEVDDAAAALDALAARPGVDPNRLYATGHSIGGTIVMLLAEISPRLKGVMACGGCPDMQSLYEAFNTPIFDETFDHSNPLEGDLRSPSRHIKDLQCPLLLCYGEEGDEPYIPQATMMQMKATELGKQMTVEIIPGDHFSALPEAMQRSITFFQSQP